MIPNSMPCQTGENGKGNGGQNASFYSTHCMYGWKWGFMVELWRTMEEVHRAAASRPTHSCVQISSYFVRTYQCSKTTCSLPGEVDPECALSFFNFLVSTLVFAEFPSSFSVFPAVSATRFFPRGGAMFVYYGLQFSNNSALKWWQ